jgi:hypothetical protein
MFRLMMICTVRTSKYQSFEPDVCIHLQATFRKNLLILENGSRNFSHISAPIYYTLRHHILKDDLNNGCCHRTENLKPNCVLR